MPSPSLDISRYIETAKRRSWQSRQELVETMAALSLFHTVASARVILPCEINAAFHRRFGRPAVSRIAQVFGRGIAHAAGGRIRTDGRLELPPDLPVPPGYLAQVEAAMQATLEYCMLLGPSPEMEESPEQKAIKAAMTQDVEYAKELEGSNKYTTISIVAGHGLNNVPKINKLFHFGYQRAKPILRRSWLNMGFSKREA